jgi:uncharacterized protein YndB with AHSA1/START domain
MKSGRYAILALLLPTILVAQEVRNTSYVASSGEKVLRLEATVPIPRADAWKLFATEEGLKKWIAPVVSLDLHVGGQILTNYDSTKSTGDPGTIHLPILNFIDRELLTLRVELNESFSKSVRDQDQNLQEIIQLIDAGNGQTRIITSMIGWGKSPEWDTTYDFFAKGNEWTYKELLRVAR